MADPAPTSTSETSSQALSHFSSSLFVKLPAGLQLQILSHCLGNDLVCLSLSSHSLRDLTLPLIPRRPSLLSFDQTLPTGAIECSCGDRSMIGVSQDATWHRRRRHMYMYENKDRFGENARLQHWNCPSHGHECQIHSACRRYPADHPICHQRRCTHCSCTTCPLHVRLRGWMGDRKFCRLCRKFTVRSQTKKYKGRCLRGNPLTRRMPNNRWIIQKGQSYGYRWWRGWGTWGIEIWGYPEGDPTADVSEEEM